MYYEKKHVRLSEKQLRCIMKNQAFYYHFLFMAIFVGKIREREDVELVAMDRAWQQARQSSANFGSHQAQARVGRHEWGRDRRKHEL